MFNTSCVRLNGPPLKLVLLWNGTLTRSAIRFCDFFAKSSSSEGSREYPRLVEVVASEMPRFSDTAGTVAEVQFASERKSYSRLTVQCGLKPYSTPAPTS